jgi:4-hydroxyphenylpyruvate dioxygenase
MPGDGDFQLPAVIDQLKANGYDGWVSLELMNPLLWQLKPAAVAEIGVAALRRLVGAAV